MATQTKDQENATETQRSETNRTDSVERTPAPRQPVDQQTSGSVVQAIRTGQASALSLLRSQTDLALRDGRALVNVGFDLLETVVGAQRRIVDELVDAQWALNSQAVDIVDGSDSRPARTAAVR